KLRQERNIPHDQHFAPDGAFENFCFELANYKHRVPSGTFNPIQSESFSLKEALLFTKTIFTRAWRFAFFLSFVLVLSTAASAQTKLLRFPDIHGDRVAFTYGGDIWTASATGGTAIRLTAHPGMEVFAKF